MTMVVSQKIPMEIGIFCYTIYMAEILTFSELAKKVVNAAPKHRQRMIAIDGGGAGKTTFASCLQNEIAGSFIVKIDDFYRPPQLRSPIVSTQTINPNFDWDRFRTLVLEAIKNNNPVCYQLYDFKIGTLSGNIVQVPRDATIIVEGVWSLQQAFMDFYDYRIWLEAPAETRLERGMLRDGEGMRKEWEQEWIPADQYYQKTSKPHLHADCVVDSANSDFKSNRIVLK
jgi:uridine kinase